MAKRGVNWGFVLAMEANAALWVLIAWGVRELLRVLA
jgi:hypothetical protein